MSAPRPAWDVELTDELHLVPGGGSRLLLEGMPSDPVARDALRFEFEQAAVPRAPHLVGEPVLEDDAIVLPIANDHPDFVEMVDLATEKLRVAKIAAQIRSV